MEMKTRNVPENKAMYITVAAKMGCRSMLTECSVKADDGEGMLGTASAESAPEVTSWRIHCACFPACDLVVIKFHHLPEWKKTSPQVCEIKMKGEPDN